MLRQFQLEYPGAIYHVRSRGDLRDVSCLEDVDRHDFMKTLVETHGCQDQSAPVPD